ncbi:MAG: pilus assembly protein PilM [Gammaproteobacteria bacterium]|nr:MAG: pilus assembly protein PilM [Gammaproteobacteria bacterium]
MFGKSSQSLLGIDISSSVVKVLELSKKGDKYIVESYAVEPLSENAVVDSGIENKEDVASAIRRALKQSGSKAKDTAVAVPANATITKVLSYPADLSEREMEEQILLDAESHIPYPIEEVRLDFEILGPSESDENAVDVLLAASRSENVDARTDVIEMAGLKPKVVDVEAYTIENAFPFLTSQLPLNGQGLTVAVVDIGATVTTLHVLVDGKIVFTREQAFGGKMLTDNISQHYGMSSQEAGQAKKENNLPDDYGPKVLDPFKQLMVATVTRALQFFFSTSTQYHSIDHILLAGGCASIQGVDSLIESETNTTTTIANPFVDMSLSSKVSISALNRDAPSMLIACGLAIRNFS